jgi:hypothetical protein
MYGVYSLHARFYAHVDYAHVDFYWDFYGVLYGDFR